MGEDTGTVRREVDEARAQLGETVEELAYRVTAPKRVAREGARRLRRAPLGPIGAAALVAVCLIGIAVARALRS